MYAIVIGLKISKYLFYLDIANGVSYRNFALNQKSSKIY